MIDMSILEFAKVMWRKSQQAGGNPEFRLIPGLLEQYAADFCTESSSRIKNPLEVSSLLNQWPAAMQAAQKRIATAPSDDFAAKRLRETSMCYAPRRPSTKAQRSGRHTPQSYSSMFTGF